VPFAPGGNGVVASPVGFELLAELFDFFRSGSWHNEIVTHTRKNATSVNNRGKQTEVYSTYFFQKRMTPA